MWGAPVAKVCTTYGLILTTAARVPKHKITASPPILEKEKTGKKKLKRTIPVISKWQINWSDSKKYSFTEKDVEMYSSKLQGGWRT